MTLRHTIAAAQTIARPGDVAANVEQHLRLARTAAAGGAVLLLFPELSLTGYELGLARELAFSRRDPRLRSLVDAAGSLGLTLVVGAPVRIGPRLHIGSLILSPDGSAEIYTKHHLGAFPSSAGPGGRVPPAEATVFDPGDSNPLVRLGEEHAAIAVCADVSHPSHPAGAAGRGAVVYLASMFVIPSDLEGEARRLREYARRHTMAVVLANHGGPTGGLASAGGSAIWSERGELIARLEGDGAGVVVATRDRGGWRGGAIALS